MKNYYLIIFVLILVLGFIVFNYLDKSSNYSTLSKSQHEVESQVGESIIEITDPDLNFTKEIKFKNKQAILDHNDQEIIYTILDILQPFNIDDEGEKEYPFLLKKEYNTTQLLYLIISRKESNKFTCVDQIKIGNPQYIEEIYELDDREVIIEGVKRENNQIIRFHLAYRLENDQIIPDPNNIDIDSITVPTEKKQSLPPSQNTLQNDTTKNQSGKIALTFDDGPAIYTSNILDVLAEKNVNATFFMIGENIQNHSDIIQRIYDEGHEIGNHTWDHSDLSKLSYDTQKEEIEKTNNAIQNITGSIPKIFRPPYGNFNDDTNSILSSLSMQKYLWNIDTRDWSGLSSDEIYTRATQDLFDQAIILMHDGVNNSIQTATSLPKVIDTIRNRGFELVTLSNL
jgi:peptidoglycan/xylan/chitin deacetylase (PgdA/CDA1 family)